jgi:hypothetical protein
MTTRKTMGTLNDKGSVTARHAEDQGDCCAECGVAGHYYDDICYQCQCTLHTIGRYDMDGNGWVVYRQ